MDWLRYSGYRYVPGNFSIKDKLQEKIALTDATVASHRMAG